MIDEHDKWGSTVAGSEVEATIRRKTIEDCLQVVDLISWNGAEGVHALMVVKARINALREP